MANRRLCRPSEKPGCRRRCELGRSARRDTEGLGETVRGRDCRLVWEAGARPGAAGQIAETHQDFFSCSYSTCGSLQ